MASGVSERAVCTPVPMVTESTLSQKFTAQESISVCHSTGVNLTTWCLSELHIMSQSSFLHMDKITVGKAMCFMEANSKRRHRGSQNGSWRFLISWSNSVDKATDCAPGRDLTPITRHG